ncbi:hypothetical protein TCON_0028 [Astathelohania contejeani]|uniref:Uncharacterized protein n=1 Tax=Astathelohania contejeani TaxID=164912 RepID=A0ABQ7I2V8_9MICR|nr:hypothetical protein TCON_0028 [Thelohania contejeani]
MYALITYFLWLVQGSSDSKYLIDEQYENAFSVDMSDKTPSKNEQYFNSLSYPIENVSINEHKEDIVFINSRINLFKSKHILHEDFLQACAICDLKNDKTKDDVNKDIDFNLINEEFIESKKSKERIFYHYYPSYNNFWTSFISNFIFLENLHTNNLINESNLFLDYIIDLNEYNINFLYNHDFYTTLERYERLIDSLIMSIGIKKIYNFNYDIFSHIEFLYYSEYNISKNLTLYDDLKKRIKNKLKMCFIISDNFLFIILPEILSFKRFIERKNIKFASNLSFFYLLNLIIKMCDCRENFEFTGKTKYTTNRYHDYNYMPSFNQQKLQVQNFIIKILNLIEDVIPYQIAYTSLYYLNRKILNSMFIVSENREMGINIQISNLISNIIFLIDFIFLSPLTDNINQAISLYYNENEDIKKISHALLLKKMLKDIPAIYIINLYILLNNCASIFENNEFNLSKRTIEKIKKIKEQQKLYLEFYSQNIPKNLMEENNLLQSIINLFHLYEMYKLTLNDTSFLLGHNGFMKLYNQLSNPEHWAKPIKNKKWQC